VKRLDDFKFASGKQAGKKGIKHRTLVDADHGIYHFPFDVARNIKRESKFQEVRPVIAGNRFQPATVQFTENAFFLAQI
jgi:hypothetical protein